MSRLGKKPITLPSGVSVSLDTASRKVQVKGPKGTLAWQYPTGIAVKESKDEKAAHLLVTLEQSFNNGLIDSSQKALWGLTRSKIHNMAEGVAKGFTVNLEIHGVGFKAQVEGEKIVFALGASHPVVYRLPAGVTATVDPKQTLLNVTGVDREMVGQVASDIRALRPPEPYKGKGVRYAGEVIVRKAGKAAAAAGAGGTKK